MPRPSTQGSLRQSLPPRVSPLKIKRRRRTCSGPSSVDATPLGFAQTDGTTIDTGFLTPVHFRRRYSHGYRPGSTVHRRRRTCSGPSSIETLKPKLLRPRRSLRCLLRPPWSSPIFVSAVLVLVIVSSRPLSPWS